MKAFAATGIAAPLTASLELVEVDEPRPAPDEALISVEAYSVNRGEALSLNGRFGPGTPAAGRVDHQVDLAVAKQGHGVHPGRLVADLGDDRRHGDAVVFEVGGRAARGGQREAQLDEPAGRRHARCFVPVGE